MFSTLLVFKKPLMFLDKHKQFINNLLPYFFLSYFVLVFLPYIVADIPFLNNFFMGSITKLIYRTITTAYLCLYGLFVGYVNKQSIKWPFVIFGFVLILCYLLSIVISPKYYLYAVSSLTSRVELYEFYIGNYSYITYGFSFLADVVSFLIFICYIPSAMKSIKQTYLTLLFLVCFMFIACGYSMIKERNAIISLMNGASEYNVSVRSFFHSKNAFGLFLFVGALSSVFLLATMISKWKYLLLMALLAFTIMPLLAMCKSAFLCCLILDVLTIWYFVFFSKGIAFYVSLSLAILSLAFMVGLIFIMVIPSLSSGPFSQIYSLASKLFRGIFTRTDTWGMVKYVVYGPFIWIGMNESNATFHLDIISHVIEDKNILDYHSGYVTWYAHHGIIGCAIYALLVGFIFYKIILIMKNNKNIGCVLLVSLVSCFVFMIPESYILFISISSYTFVINIIVICCTMFLSNNIKNNKIEGQE